MSANDLADRLRAQRHYECADCWYSCPESDEGCCNDTEEGCTCSAPLAHEAADEIERLRRQLDTLRSAIGDPDELRWHRWHCEATGSGDDLRELLVRIADAVDALAAVGDPEACPSCGWRGEPLDQLRHGLSIDCPDPRHTQNPEEGATDE